MLGEVQVVALPFQPHEGNIAKLFANMEYIPANYICVFSLSDNYVGNAQQKIILYAKQQGAFACTCGWTEDQKSVSTSSNYSTVAWAQQFLPLTLRVEALVPADTYENAGSVRCWKVALAGCQACGLLADGGGKSLKDQKLPQGDGA